MDWRSHPWMTRRLEEGQKKEITGEELAQMDVEDFRDHFFGTPLDLEKSMHYLLNRFESFPEGVAPEIVRFIEIGGHYEYMGKVLNSSHPSVLAYILKNLPQTFNVQPDHLVEISKDPSFPEIVYRMCTIKWSELNQESKWDEFFNVFIENKDDLPAYLFDYILSSPNCSPQQLLQALEELCDDANGYRLVHANAISQQPNAIGESDLFEKLFELGLEEGKGCRDLLLSLLHSPEVKTHVTVVIHSLKSEKLSPFIQELYDAIACNPVVVPRRLKQQHYRNTPLMKGLSKRKDLLDELYVEEILEFDNDDIMASLLERHGHRFMWTQMILDNIFARIFNGDFMTGIAFASVSNLPLDSLDCIIDTNPIACLGVSRREDLPIAIRDKLLGSTDTDVQCGVLRSESRKEVLEKFFSSDICFDEAIASNKSLPSIMRMQLFHLNSEKAFRVHRTLALREDLIEEEINILLTKRDLDVYHNMCLNHICAYSREQVIQLTNFAQTSREEQLEWLPCLKQMHKDKEDEELCEMLMSYQSEMRLLLQQCDKDHNLNRVDDQMTIAWTSDPDFSVTMGIINSSKKLSNYMMSLIVENEANAVLLEDKLLSLIDRCQDMTFEVLESIVKKGKENVSRKILQLISLSFTGSALFILEKGGVAVNKQQMQAVKNDSFTDPKKFVLLMRGIFDAHKSDADIMKGIVQLLKSAVFSLGEKYTSNEDHIKTRIDDLLLDICTDFRVPRESIDQMVGVASPTILCHILNVGNLNHSTLWSVYVKEVLTSNSLRGPVLRCLALRDNLPADLRFCLAMLQSKLSNEVPSKSNSSSGFDSMEIDSPEKNELLHLLLSTGSAIPREVVHYYMECEPDEIINLLHSSDLSGPELIYIRDKVLPSITNYNSPVQLHFESFVAAVQSLAGFPLTMDDICFDGLNSKVLNNAISYARGGIELQLLPDFLTQTLKLSIPTDNMKFLLEALEILFNYENESGEKKKEPEAPNPFSKSSPAADEPEEEEEVPVTSLPITSILKAKEQFPKIVLSVDIRQYLPAYLEKGFLSVSPDASDDLITIPAKHEELFGDTFAEAINHQMDRFLSYHFSKEISNRKKQFTQQNLKDILKSKHLSLDEVLKYGTAVEVPDCEVFQTVQMLIDAGLGTAKSKDLNWLTSQLFEIAKGMTPNSFPNEQANEQKKRKVELEISPKKLESLLIKPILDAATISTLPYVAVFSFAELLPDVSISQFPKRIRNLLFVWGKPEETEKRTTHQLLNEVGFILDMMEKEGKDLLQQLVLCVEKTLLLSLENGHLSFGKIVQGSDTEADFLTHQCNLEILEASVYSTIQKCASDVSNVMNSLFTTSNFKASGSNISWCHFDAQAKPLNEIRSLEVLTVELMDAVIHHTGSALSLASTIDDISSYISPFRQLINIAPISYRVGRGHTQMTPGNILYRFKDFLADGKQKTTALSSLLICLEQCDFCVHKVESIFKNAKEPLESIMKLNLDHLLTLPRQHNFILLSNELLQECKSKVEAAYNAFLEDRKKTINRLLQLCSVTLISEPDFEHTIKKIVYEAEPVPGLFMVQHALLLDDDSMPIIDNDKGELVRDEKSEKTRQPVMNVVSVEKFLPTSKIVNKKLQQLEFISSIPAFHLQMLFSKIEEFEAKLTEANATKFTSISKPYLDELVSSMEKQIKEGVRMGCPSGKPGPPFQYDISLIADVYGKKIEQIKSHNQALDSVAESCIRSFAISRRSTLPQEMIKYLVLLQKSSFREDSKLRRLYEAAVCTTVMQADVNYHVLLEDTSVVKFIFDILLRIGEKLFQIENERQRGTILICFPCSMKGLGVMCISSTYRADAACWDRYLHYNSNACAAEEYGELVKEVPPYDLGNGVTYEAVFSGANKRNIVLTFTENAIQQKKAELHKQTLDVIKEGNVHDESNLGQSLNLGQINWVVRKEGKIQINHLHCEAAMCNASPLLSLIEEGGKLVMKTSYQEAINQLLALQQSGSFNPNSRRRY